MGFLLRRARQRAIAPSAGGEIVPLQYGLPKIPPLGGFRACGARAEGHQGAGRVTRASVVPVQRLWLRARRLGHDELLDGPEADRLQQHGVEATREEALLLL